MLKCAITGSDGVLGKKIRKVLPFKFYSLNQNILNFNKVFKWINSREYDLNELQDRILLYLNG